MAEPLQKPEAGVTPSTEQQAQQPKQRSRLWPVLFALVLLAGAGIGVRYYLYARAYEWTDDAFIAGTIVQVSPKVPGQLIKINVSDNQDVKKGDLLAEIDPSTYDADSTLKQTTVAMAQSKEDTAKLDVKLTQATSDATIAQARAEVEASQANVEAAKTEVAAAEAEAERAEKDYKRYEHLQDSAVSRQQSDLAAATSRVAQARLAAAHKEVAAAEAQVAAAQGNLAKAQAGKEQVAVRNSEVQQSTAAVQQAKAAQKLSDLHLSFTKIYAPVDGQVTRKAVDVGEYVQTGQVLMALVPHDVWVVANFKETQLTNMRVGQPVTVEVDAYPHLKLKGHVDSIQMGTGAQFSLLPPENATGNYVKVVQRVPVKILLDNIPDNDVVLAPGMSVVPQVKVR